MAQRGIKGRGRRDSMGELGKDEVLQRIERSWAALLAAVEAVPEGRKEEPGVCGEWSLADLLGHVAVWDRQVQDDIRGFDGGDAPIELDTDALNASEAEARAGHSFADARAEMARTHALMLEVLATARSVDDRMIAVDTWEHYDDHLREIDAWRRR